MSPKSVLFNWLAEIARFRPDLKVAAYSGTRRALDPDADLIVTTYPILRNDIDVLADVPWDIVILDESQTIKNPDSQVARAAYKLRAGWKLTLSGTPIENRLDELWSQLHFTNPSLLGGRADFQERWATPISAGGRNTSGMNTTCEEIAMPTAPIARPLPNPAAAPNAPQRTAPPAPPTLFS